MDETFTREKKKPARRKVEPENETKLKNYSNKLKNDLSRNEAMRKKLKIGKADSIKTLTEDKADKICKQKKAMVYKEAAVLSKVRTQIAEQNEDQNAGGEAMNVGASFVEGSLYSKKAKSKENTSSGYSKKLHAKRQEEVKGKGTSVDEGTSGMGTSQAQKKYVKRELQKQTYNSKTKKASNGVGSVAKKWASKAEGALAKGSKAAVDLAKVSPLAFLYVGVILFIILHAIGYFYSISLVFSGMSGTILSTTFTAQDKDIVQVDNNYKALEKKIQKEIDSIESEYPGYDEYEYFLNEISHNPFELAALLTVLYEDYTPPEVQSTLETIKDLQYKIEKEEVVETRTRTVTKWHWVTRYRTENQDGNLVPVPYPSYEPYEEEEEYEYHILKVTLTNYSVDYVARNKMGLTADQLERYEILLETFGNKKYLFENDPYAVPTPGEYDDYKVPSEFLTDQEFAKMLKEAQKYLGYPYVWGGSSPSTSFDCSGFVSYVINNCGNGWNVGRQTANGLLSKCTRISANNAKPGDLIFFQGTYNTAGASHVGIYVGNGMMIHCGNPIQYTSINSSYWQSHFYTFGRLNH